MGTLIMEVDRAFRLQQTEGMINRLSQTMLIRMWNIKNIIRSVILTII